MSVRMAPWMCWRCGYTMDSATSMSKSRKAPAEGDASMCLNCGALYTLHGGQFVPMTSTERAALSPKAARLFEQAEIARRLVIRADLAKRDGRT